MVNQPADMKQLLLWLLLASLCPLASRSKYHGPIRASSYLLRLRLQLLLWLRLHL